MALRQCVHTGSAVYLIVNTLFCSVCLFLLLQKPKGEDALSVVAADVHRNVHKRDPFNEKFVHLAQVRLI